MKFSRILRKDPNMINMDLMYLSLGDSKGLILIILALILISFKQIIFLETFLVEMILLKCLIKTFLEVACLEEVGLKMYNIQEIPLDLEDLEDLEIWDFKILVEVLEEEISRVFLVLLQWVVVVVECQGQFQCRLVFKME